MSHRRSARNRRASADRAAALRDPRRVAQTPAGAAALAALAAPVQTPAMDGPFRQWAFRVPYRLAAELHGAVVETLLAAGREDLCWQGSVAAFTAALDPFADDNDLPGSSSIAIGAFCTAFAACDRVLAVASPEMDPALGKSRVSSLSLVQARTHARFFESL